jgi:hypothetical protein
VLKELAFFKRKQALRWARAFLLPFSAEKGSRRKRRNHHSNFEKKLKELDAGTSPA